jgi:hypothetical protein
MASGILVGYSSPIFFPEELKIKKNQNAKLKICYLFNSVMVYYSLLFLTCFLVITQENLTDVMKKLAILNFFLNTIGVA